MTEHARLITPARNTGVQRSELVLVYLFVSHHISQSLIFTQDLNSFEKISQIALPEFFVIFAASVEPTEYIEAHVYLV